MTTLPNPFMPAKPAALYVKRMDTTSYFGMFRLLWWDGEGNTFVMAEGECSAKAFKRRKDAIAYGRRAYGETAKPVPRGF
jgi:hypothetical protein